MLEYAARLKGLPGGRRLADVRELDENHLVAGAAAAAGVDGRAACTLWEHRDRDHWRHFGRQSSTSLCDDGQPAADRYGS